MQTTIHHPTDSGLLVDSVRVLSRFVQRAKGLVINQLSHIEKVCRSRPRTARQTAQTLHRQLRRKGEEKEAQQKELYQKLIETTEQMVCQSQQVIAALQGQTEKQARRLLTQARAYTSSDQAGDHPDPHASARGQEGCFWRESTQPV